MLQQVIAEIVTVYHGSKAGRDGGVTGVKASDGRGEGVSAGRGVCEGGVHMVAGCGLIRHAGLCDGGMAQRPVTS